MAYRDEFTICIIRVGHIFHTIFSVLDTFKLYYSDTGLLLSQYAPQTTLNVIANATSVNFGAVYENAVAQELTPVWYLPLYMAFCLAEDANRSLEGVRLAPPSFSD